jgi:NADPH2:quinone reductase
LLEASFHVVPALGWGAHALAPLSFKSVRYSGVFPSCAPHGEGRGHHGAIVCEAVRPIEDRGWPGDAPGRSPPFFPRGRFGRCQALKAGSACGKLVVEMAALN